MYIFSALLLRPLVKVLWPRLYHSQMLKLDFFLVVCWQKADHCPKPAVKVSEAVFTVDCAIFHLFKHD